MLTYRTGMAGAPATAQAMAEYLAKETNVAGLSEKMAQYYGNGLMSEEGDVTAAVPRRDMNAAVASVLGIDPSKPLTTMQVASLLTGLRADAQPIPGRKLLTKKRTPRISYVDFTLSAPKSFSVALALAPTDAERAMLDRAWRDAVDKTMDVVAEIVGTAKRGADYKKIRQQGHVAIIMFDHFTARPTLKVARNENGVEDTELAMVNVAGDPQRHTHCIMPSVVVTDDGHIGRIHQHAIKQRVHELGSICQAFLATNLRQLGVEVELDSRPNLEFNERMARLTAVPQRISDLFSNRTQDGEIAARDYAASHGFDFDSMSADDKVKMLKGSVSAIRQMKEIGADIEAWKKQAKEAGYTHRSVLRPGEERGLAPRERRLQEAYDLSLPMLEEQFSRRAVIEGSIPRIAAAKALIQTGIESAAEVNAITSAHRSEGVKQDGQMTFVHWAFDPSERLARLTTQLSVDQEEEAIRILRSASEDKSTSISPRAVQKAVTKVEEESRAKGENLDFSKGHGLEQRKVIDKIAASGRAAVLVGTAGSGKSTLLRPLISAWQEDGREVYGATLAWRQTNGLKDAGIGKSRSRRYSVPNKDHLTGAGVDEQRTFALSPILQKMESGKLKLSKKSVLVIDEIGLVGTKQILRLARLQEKHGFQLVGIGDDMQCQSIDAGSTIDLCRRAFGADAVPELLSTIRQNLERDRETSLMFRQGRAKDALERKDVDGTLKIVPGGYSEAVQATVDLWWERRESNQGRERYTLGITVPTNDDGRAIGEEIRRRRRLAGELGPDLCKIDATDQSGAIYSMALAPGDRVRLFSRVYGKDSENRSGLVGENGTIVEVVGASKSHLTVRKPSGKVAAIEWSDLGENARERHEKKRSGIAAPMGDGERILLSRGDAVTVDARQSDTVTEHIFSMPSGSAPVNGFKAYVAESRMREKSWIVTSQGAEKMEIETRRAIGDPRNAVTDPSEIREAIIENMGRNLSRQPKKTLATDFMERAVALKTGTVRAMQAAWHRHETGRTPRPQEKAEENRNVKVVAATVAALTARQDAVARVIENASSKPALVERVIEASSPPAAPTPNPSAPVVGPAHAGWKLALNVEPSESNPTTRNIMDWLESEGIRSTIGIPNGGDGRGLTIYAGGYAKARDLADELEWRFRLPEASIRPEDARWSQGIKARFDSPYDAEFHHSGAAGVPILQRHAEDSRGLPTPDGFNLQNAREAETILIARYGAVYGPGVLPKEAPATPTPDILPVREVPQRASAARPTAPAMSEADMQASFAAELGRIGLRLPGPPVMDGQKHTAPVEGNRGKRKSGFYRASPDGRAGFGMNSRTGEQITWKAAGGARPISEEQREQDRAARVARQQQQIAREEVAAVQARAIWAAAVPADPQHSYLVRKGIGPESLRQGAPGQVATYEVDGEQKLVRINGRLIIPLRDNDGTIRNVQMIAADGSKMFLQGRKRELFTAIGDRTPEAEPIVVVEGYATGATLRQVTGLQVVVAFDAGNLHSVATAIRQHQPERPIIVAADNDHHAPRRDKPLPNVGVEKASEAAATVGGMAVVPKFDPSDRGTDWNDYAAKHGRQATREALETALAGVQLPPMPPERTASPAKEVTQEQRDAARSVARGQIRRPRPSVETAAIRQTDHQATP